MECNLCGCTEFLDMRARKAVRCRNCASLERTRLLWLYIEQMVVVRTTKVLHLAPEKGLYMRLREMVDAANYVTADFDPARYAFADDCRSIDLTDLEHWPSEEFDLILHSHVLEHVPCNVAYPLYHLHRMLRRDGVHLCVIPFSSGVYDECLDDIGDQERERRFGQGDHVRKFGRDGRAMTLGTIVRLPDHFDATDDFDEGTLQRFNIPVSHWRGFHMGTVLRLRKDDYRLGHF